MHIYMHIYVSVFIYVIYMHIYVSVFIGAQMSKPSRETSSSIQMSNFHAGLKNHVIHTVYKNLKQGLDFCFVFFHGHT